MTQKSFSDRFGANFGRKSTVGGPTIDSIFWGFRPKQLGTEFWSVHGIITAKIRPKPLRIIFIFGYLNGGGWVLHRLVYGGRCMFAPCGGTHWRGAGERTLLQLCTATIKNPLGPGRVHEFQWVLAVFWWLAHSDEMRPRGGPP